MALEASISDLQSDRYAHQPSCRLTTAPLPSIHPTARARTVGIFSSSEPFASSWVCESFFFRIPWHTG
jgi:hypothetical protein